MIARTGKQDRERADHRLTRKEGRMKRAMSCLAIGVLFTSGAAAQSLAAGDLATHCNAGATEAKAVCSLVIKTMDQIH
jgi:hypothetical protein